MEVSISSKELIGVVLRGSLFTMSFVLTACGVFDSNRGALDASSEVIKRETPVRSSAARLASSELLDIQTVNNDAQDILISEVNRDGEPLSFFPYDNSVLVLDVYPSCWLNELHNLHKYQQ